MPYKIVKQGAEWCVYKEDLEGRPIGETVGCHDSEAEAKKHLAALYANVPDAERGQQVIIRTRRPKVTQPNALQDGIERRDLLDGAVELRLDGESGQPTVEGYAAVFNSPSEVLFEWENGRFRERVAAGAFRKTITEQNVPLLVEHAQLPLATTGAGTLQLAEDDHGLRFQSVLDMSDPDVQRLVPKMRRGDMNRCSFGFVPIRESWDERAKPRMRTLHEVRLIDVSIVSRPAYQATEAKVRKVLAEDGLDAEAISELLVRLRMGLPLDDEDVTLMRRLAETFGRFVPGEPNPPAPFPAREGGEVGDATATREAPAPSGPPGERTQPATQTGGPDPKQVHPIAWYRDVLSKWGV